MLLGIISHCAPIARIEMNRKYMACEQFHFVNYVTAVCGHAIRRFEIDTCQSGISWFTRSE